MEQYTSRSDTPTRRLRDGAADLGIALSARQLDQFRRYYEVLIEGNRRANLTRIVEWDAVQVRHFLDSLTCWLGFRDLAQPERLRLMDVGSGAGFPGVPLKLAFPDLRLTLLDSLGKRIAFAEELLRELRLDDVALIYARAEDAGRDPGQRERYDVALARALAPLPVLVELCLPFIRPGGRLVAPRRGDLEAELRAARTAIRELGGDNGRIVPVQAAGLDDGRALVVVDKVRHTPGRYPRRAGIPERNPIGAPDGA